MMFLTILSCCNNVFLKKRLVGALSGLSVDVTLEVQLQRAISVLWLRVDHLSQIIAVLMANDGGYKILTSEIQKKISPPRNKTTR